LRGGVRLSRILKKAIAELKDPLLLRRHPARQQVHSASVRGRVSFGGEAICHYAHITMKTEPAACGLQGVGLFC